MKAHIARTRTAKFVGISILVGSVFTALTGCAPAGPAGPGNSAEGAANKSPAAISTFEFKTPAYGAKDTLKIQIPRDLTDVSPEAKNALVTSVTATARKLNSPKYCAVDLAVTYADGALDELKKPRKNVDGSTAEDTRPVLERVAYALTGLPYRSIQGTLEGGVASSITALNESDPKYGFYATEDFKTITKVQRCAASPMDDSKSYMDNTVQKFNFPHIASIGMTVMKDGTLTVVQGAIEGYKLDSSGNWLAK
jgi:hypothetical protein